MNVHFSSKKMEWATPWELFHVWDIFSRAFYPGCVRHLGKCQVQDVFFASNQRPDTVLAWSMLDESPVWP